MVIAMHTMPLLEINKFISFEIYNVLSRVAVPFFFVVSGYFYSQKIEDNKNYFKKYARNIFLLYLIWSLVYFPYDFIYSRLIKLDHSIIRNTLSYLRAGLFKGTHSHLWYLPSSVFGMYLLDLFYKRKLLNLKLTKIIVWGIYSIGLFGMSYYGISKFLGLGKLYEVYFKVFLTTRNGLFFGFPLMYLGYSLNKCNLEKYSKKRLIKNMILFFIFLNIETFALKYFEIARNFDMTISLIFLTYYLMIFLLKDPFSDWKKIKDYSFEVYAVHGIYLILVRNLLKGQNTMQFIITVFLSIITAYWIKKVSRKYKEKKYFINYNVKYTKKE